MNRIALIVAAALLAAACAQIPLGDVRDSRVNPGTRTTPAPIN